MQTLIDRALKSNLDLLTAVSRVREARQQEIIAGASGLPQINASGLAAHVHSNLSLLSKLGAPSLRVGRHRVRRTSSFTRSASMRRGRSIFSAVFGAASKRRAPTLKLPSGRCAMAK
jgi:outer membrane protein TolC